MKKVFVFSVLIFSSIGFEIQEVTINSNNNYSIRLVEKDSQLDEVVVTALGIQRKAKSLTYSTQKVNNADLTGVKDANVINNINGRVSGVTVNRSASGAGGSARVILRGQKSTRENQPLYVIDGVPMSNYSPAQPTDVWGQGSGSGSGGRDGVASGTSGQPPAAPTQRPAGADRRPGGTRLPAVRAGRAGRSGRLARAGLDTGVGLHRRSAVGRGDPHLGAERRCRGRPPRHQIGAGTLGKMIGGMSTPTTAAPAPSATANAAGAATAPAPRFSSRHARWAPRPASTWW